ncbi:MAG: hypothetical protein HY841_05985 [Bacteroidetes bacterium]|nr:hypothetical protein [Bacteroidota bacterium]
MEFGIWNLGLIISVIGVACNKEEPIPSYIHIDKINFTTNYLLEGSSSNKILDAWIYIDDQQVGAFELPCTVPVLAEGSHEIKIWAGIKENGIAETRIKYPFYETFSQTVILTRGQITTISPTVTYAANADFTWLEDFEGSSHSVCNSGVTADSIMTITTAPSDVFEGTGSGKVSITSSSYIGISCAKYILPQGGASVFLELDYNCNTEFNIGIIGYTANNTIDVQWTSLTLRPTTGWNKVYINLGTEVSNATNSTKFSIFFSMLKDENLANSYFYLDNVKLIN